MLPLLRMKQKTTKKQKLMGEFICGYLLQTSGSLFFFFVFD